MAAAVLTPAAALPQYPVRFDPFMGVLIGGVVLALIITVLVMGIRARRRNEPREPGWYPEMLNGQERFWDGTGPTDEVRFRSEG
jgi:hypothetical protein